VRSHIQPSASAPAGTGGGPVPAGIAACLFDVDGVLTRTAEVHAAAWREMFDAFLADRPAADGEDHRPFRMPEDYLAHVDGRLRLDGVRTFLASRGIALPEGSDSDPPEADTVHGLGARKNARVRAIIADGGVRVFPGSLRYLDAVERAGLPCAVVSASRNCRAVLESVGLADRFRVRVDGVAAAERGLGGKPAPDMFLAAASDLGVAPSACAVYEDAVAGVQAGRAGAFGWVVGVDREGNAPALAEAGADVVVPDLAQLLEAP
jgi:beta-phosphoglucomutase family hydrolase